MILVLFGPPGAGKGTQAAFLCKELNIPQIATGDIFRKHLKEGTELGKLARSYMNNGQLVPDEVVWDIVETRLAQDDCANGMLLDGFPRTVRQAELMLGWLDGQGRVLNAVLALEVPDEELVLRLSGRRTCRDCQATYHVAHNPPGEDGRCVRCGGEVIQREDDQEDTVRKRLATYHRDTSPVLAFFEERGYAHRIDGTGAIEDVTRRLRDALA
ncbi:MAG: adenylate kinase [Alphaproteobacteria bacterium]|nr:adenylate kinase [Alphaproteobacteria bacterium]